MRSPRFFLFLENISYTLCEIKYQLIFMVGRWIWDDEILFQVYPIEVDSKWLRKRKEEHGTSLWVQEWGTKHQIKRFFLGTEIIRKICWFPTYQLILHLHLHPFSPGIYIWTLPEVPKMLGTNKKKMSDLPTWSQPPGSQTPPHCVSMSGPKGADGMMGITMAS